MEARVSMKIWHTINKPKRNYWTEIFDTEPDYYIVDRNDWRAYFCFDLITLTKNTDFYIFSDRLDRLKAAKFDEKIEYEKAIYELSVSIIETSEDLILFLNQFNFSPFRLCVEDYTKYDEFGRPLVRYS
jgi:hypothetical protein